MSHNNKQRRNKQTTKQVTTVKYKRTTGTPKQRMPPKPRTRHPKGRATAEEAAAWALLNVRDANLHGMFPYPAENGASPACASCILKSQFVFNDVRRGNTNSAGLSIVIMPNIRDHMRFAITMSDDGSAPSTATHSVASYTSFANFAVVRATGIQVYLENITRMDRRDGMSCIYSAPADSLSTNNSDLQTADHSNCISNEWNVPSTNEVSVSWLPNIRSSPGSMMYNQSSDLQWNDPDTPAAFTNSSSAIAIRTWSGYDLYEPQVWRVTTYMACQYIPQASQEQFHTLRSTLLNTYAYNSAIRLLLSRVPQMASERTNITDSRTHGVAAKRDAVALIKGNSNSTALETIGSKAYAIGTNVYTALAGALETALIKGALTTFGLPVAAEAESAKVVRFLTSLNGKTLWDLEDRMRSARTVEGLIQSITGDDTFGTKYQLHRSAGPHGGTETTKTVLRTPEEKSNE